MKQYKYKIKVFQYNSLNTTIKKKIPSNYIQKTFNIK